MSKTNGLGSTLLVGGAEIGNDVGSVPRISCPKGVQDVTGLDKEARERVLSLRDGMIDFAPHWNPASGGAHEALSGLPTADVQVSYLNRRTTRGAPSACLVGKQTDYQATRSAAGELTWATPNTGNGFGLEWGRAITAGVESASGAGNLDGYDHGAATSFGFQAYLHVLSLTGTNVVATIEQSSDDGSGDAYAAVTDGAFASATAPGAQRIATSNALAVEQWLRVALSGTFTAVELAVIVVRNEIAGVVF